MWKLKICQKKSFLDNSCSRQTSNWLRSKKMCNKRFNLVMRKMRRRKPRLAFKCFIFSFFMLFFSSIFHCCKNLFSQVTIFPARILVWGNWVCGSLLFPLRWLFCFFGLSLQPPPMPLFTFKFLKFSLPTWYWQKLFCTLSHHQTSVARLSELCLRKALLLPYYSNGGHWVLCRFGCII